MPDTGNASATQNFFDFYKTWLDELIWLVLFSISFCFVCIFEPQELSLSTSLYEFFLGRNMNIF